MVNLIVILIKYYPRPLSYIGADIFLLCVDLINSQSLQNTSQRWMEELSRHAPGVPILLCGTKMDLRIDKHYVNEARKKNTMVEPISFDMGVEVARSIGAVAYAETSALTGKGVEKTFEYVMRYGCEYFLAQLKKRKNSCGIS
jgi:GTPase SAR1 family protein